MSLPARSDLLTLPMGEEQVKEDEYLSVLSPKEKPWDRHRGEADDVREVYGGSAISRHRRYGVRIEQCSQALEFARDPPKQGVSSKLKFKTAWFCRVRHCPVCQWRRSLMWQAKVHRALPQLLQDYPDACFLFLTLTIRNCEVKDLRATLALMGRAWVRLTQLRCFPARGWVRAVEITRSERYRTAHPHYHCLLMVPPAYFQEGYLKQPQWAELWRQCLRIDYCPVVDIQRVQLNLTEVRQRVNMPPRNMRGAVTEVLKYSVKPSDMVRDHDWFLTLTDQLHKTRAVAIGGILKRYIKEREKEDLMREPGEEPPIEEKERLFFGWKQGVRKYRKIAPVSRGKS